MKKRVLLYNWTQFDDSKGRGGGVSVYLRNIIPEYLANGVDVVFLSSGCHYSLIRRKLFYRPTSNVYSERGVKSYEVVNSPIKAPSRDSFHQIRECLDNDEISDFVVQLVVALGEFDEIHFHNIEGISTKTIDRLKEACDSKLIVWFHNYHWLCPQIELFSKNIAKCKDYRNGAECLKCIGEYRDTEKKIAIQRLVSFLELRPFFQNKYGRFLDDVLRKIFVMLRDVRSSLSITNSRKPRVDVENGKAALDSANVGSDGESYRSWRQTNLEILNKSVDTCIAVSPLVKSKMTTLGVDHEKVKVVALGMDVFKSDFVRVGTEKSSSTGSKLRVGFLGYGNVSKGLPFLCSALEQLNTRYRSQFSLHVLSKMDEHQKQLLRKLETTGDVFITDGYKRDDLPRISETLDVVVIPSLWWETFNQVAYEMVVHGVPVLYSDSVGIGDYLPDNFRFRSGNAESFLKLFTKLLDKPETLRLFWDSSQIKLNSIEEHYVKLSNAVDASFS